METSRYLTCLRHDAARLREIGTEHLDSAVPSCPEWTVADLLRHVSEAYQHKVRCIQLGEFPRPWPPEPSGKEPVTEFDGSLAELLAEFDQHDPADHAKTWYGPDQSVGFWIRRMTQETVIHRVDAELAAGGHTAVPADLAVDGIDEVLAIFLSWDSLDTIGREGPESWPGLASADGRTIEICAGGHAWSVTPTPSGVRYTSGGTPDAAASVTGDPVDVLLWLWRRADDHKLTVTGDRALADQLHELMYAATQ